MARTRHVAGVRSGNTNLPSVGLAMPAYDTERALRPCIHVDFYSFIMHFSETLLDSAAYLSNGSNGMNFFDLASNSIGSEAAMKLFKHKLAVQQARVSQKHQKRKHMPVPLQTSLVLET